MRKLAGILALSLVLELLTPIQVVYAGYDDVENSTVVYETKTEKMEEEVMYLAETVSDDEVQTMATDVSEQAKMYLYEEYYTYNNEGYPLSAAFVLPREMLDKNLEFTDIALSVDGGAVKKLQAVDTYVSCYEWRDYGYCTFFAGYDNTISEGSHVLSYKVTYTLNGNEYYYMDFTGEAGFSKDSGTERTYYKVTGDEFYDYMPAKKGTEVARIVISYRDHRTETERTTNVQLRNHETGELVQTTLTDLNFDEYDYSDSKADSRYKGVYDEKTDLYIWPQIPEQYYYRWGRATLVLEEDIAEGLYDVVITTDAGYTHIYDSYYVATNSSVLYGVNTTQYTEAADTVVYADNSGNYVSAFVYGLNLTEGNIPVFYDDTYTIALTEYDESDPYCHIEPQKYGINITVKKKNKLNSAWDDGSLQEHYKVMKVKVPNIENYRWETTQDNLEMPYYTEMVYREEYVKEGNFTIAPGLRLYLAAGSVKAGDKIIVEGDKYVSGKGTLELSEKFEVLFNGLEYYIHIPKKSELYSGVYYYEVTNEQTGEMEEMWIHEHHEEELQLSNILVPANCTWEIHGAKDVGNVLCSGSTTEEKEVLSAEQMIELSKYGKLRVCIYDESGKAVQRYLTFLKCGEYYGVNYVLNDSEESPARMSGQNQYYFNNRELVLEIPVRENYTFVGWYSDKKCTKKVGKIAKGSKGNKTFYAKWTPVTYSVVYQANGGTGKVSTTKWKDKETATVATNKFKRTGYVFAGWNTEQDGSGTKYDETQIITSISVDGKNQLILYAIWEPITYTVVLNKNNSDAQEGTANTSPLYINMTYGDKITLTGGEYTQKGYTIKSWNTKPNGKGKKYSLGSVANLSKNKDDVIMLYAQWGVEKYSITVDYKGGKVSGKNPTSYTFKSKDIVLKEPKRGGYLFDGYYECDPESEQFSDSMKKVSVIKAGSTGNIKLYAKWIPITYTVVLNKNSDQATSGTIKNEKEGIKSCVYDETKPYVFNGEEYIWEGKEIGAWTTKPNGKGKKYKSHTELKNITQKNGENIILYAQWETKKYTIEYRGAEGIKHKNPASYTYDESKKIALKNVTKKGYVFEGWYVGSTENEADKITVIDRSLKQNQVLLAKWTPITYTVCLKPNASDATMKPGMVQVFSVKYDENIELQADAYTRKHYRIAYWTKNAKGSGTKYQNGSVANLTSKDGALITLYPKWELVQYDIVYKNMDFENVKNSNPNRYTYSKELKLKNPTRTGYTFMGWYTKDTTLTSFNPEKEEKITKIPKGTEGTITLYAYWKPRT